MGAAIVGIGDPDLQARYGKMVKEVLNYGCMLCGFFTLAIYVLSTQAEGQQRTEPYGTWKSPITSESMVSGSTRIFPYSPYSGALTAVTGATLCHTNWRDLSFLNRPRWTADVC